MTISISIKLTGVNTTFLFRRKERLTSVKSSIMKWCAQISEFEHTIEKHCPGIPWTNGPMGER